jgi:hypothetical protein
MEQQGYMTKVFREGTERYMSPQMFDMEFNEPKFIDLYYNDMFALRVTLYDIEALKIKHIYT